MLSQDTATGRGIGSGSDALGRYLMDHVTVKTEGPGAALPGDQQAWVEDGRCIYLPRFEARDSTMPPAGRGFGVQVYRANIGGNRSFFTAVSFSEMTPRRDNRVVLHPKRVDRWGIPSSTSIARSGQMNGGVLRISRRHSRC
jgi:hypothetical protein